METHQTRLTAEKKSLEDLNTAKAELFDLQAIAEADLQQANVCGSPFIWLGLDPNPEPRG